MAAAHGYTEAQGELDVGTQMAALLEKGPTLPLSSMRSKLPAFVNMCDEHLAQMTTDPRLSQDERGQPSPEKKERLRKIHATGTVLVKMLRAAMTALNAASVAHEVAAPATQVYSPETREVAERLFAACAELRTAITDIPNDGSKALTDVRAAAGIGLAVAKSAIIAIRDLADRQRLAFAEPAANGPGETAAQARANRAYLLGQTVFIDAHLEPVVASLSRLDDSLQKASGTRKGEARRVLDAAHLRVEVIALRLVGLVHAGCGAATRDAVRALLPTSNFGQRRSDRPEPPADAPANPPAADGHDPAPPPPA